MAKKRGIAAPRWSYDSTTDRWSARFVAPDGTVFDAGPLVGDGKGRGWVELPAALVATTVSGIEDWRVSWRVTGLSPSGQLEVPRRIATRIVAADDADRWVECRGAVLRQQPAVDRELVAVHERIHRGEHRGRRPGPDLDSAGLKQIVRIFMAEHGGRRPSVYELTEAAGYTRSTLYAAAPGGLVALIEQVEAE